MIQLEDTLAQVRKEYEMLRIEFEQTLAANEQAGIVSYSCSTLQFVAKYLPGKTQCGHRDLLVLIGSWKS